MDAIYRTAGLPGRCEYTLKQQYAVQRKKKKRALDDRPIYPPFVHQAFDRFELWFSCLIKRSGKYK
jgi:hypothetical protein